MAQTAVPSTIIETETETEIELETQSLATDSTLIGAADAPVISSVRTPINNAGMLVVLGLVVVLYALISLLDRRKSARPDKPAKIAPTAAVRDAPKRNKRNHGESGIGDAMIPDTMDDELAAVLAAAVAAYTEAEAHGARPARLSETALGGLLVRRARRGPAWRHAGIREQVYSRG